MKLEILNLPSQKLNQLHKAGLFSMEDVLNRFPRKYIDGTELAASRAFGQSKELHHIRGEVINVKMVNRTSPSYCLRLTDGEIIHCTFFNSAWLTDKIRLHDTLDVIGKITSYQSWNGDINWSTVPVYFAINNPEKLTRIIPVYKKIPGMSDDYYQNILDQCLQQCAGIVDDYMPIDLQAAHHLCSLPVAYQYLHRPASAAEYQMGKRRILFDDLFLFNILLQEKASKSSTVSPFVFTGAHLMTEYYRTLPFDLTEGQKEAVRKLYHEGKRGKKISMLLQADVGYGKTEVAKMFALFGVEAGYQVAVMAPTVVLARQHFADFTKSFQGMNLHIAYLGSDITAKEKKTVLKNIKDGTVNILIGTHSCISDCVEYKKLGCVVIDEEHRFGVKQREKLMQKTVNGVHSLSLSATPIPRSLANALYGEGVEVTDIKTAPSFKKPVITKQISSLEEELPYIQTALSSHHQIYVVCPAIDENEKQNMVAVNKAFLDYVKYFENEDCRVGLLHGKMKKDEIAAVIEKFNRGEANILVSTTVVEVGVNVPNAALIIIKQADRFGLAQLHQLRGRVGRGHAQGYCLLESDTDKERLKVLVESHDGFYIAQKDLELRGGGRLTGIQQKGKNPLLEEVIRNPQLSREVRTVVQGVFTNSEMKDYFERYFQKEIEKAEEENDTARQ